jgi:hypothetical protein
LEVLEWAYQNGCPCPKSIIKRCKLRSRTKK